MPEAFIPGCIFIILTAVLASRSRPGRIKPALRTLKIALYIEATLGSKVAGLACRVRGDASIYVCCTPMSWANDSQGVIAV